MAPLDHLLPTLPTLERLALAYAPRSARDPWLAFLALDARLASLLRSASEPMLAQLRLAWWRETLGGAAHWPAGDPVLAALGSWRGRHAALVPLVEGWEALTAAPPLEARAMTELAQGRSRALAALAKILGEAGSAPAARQLATDWSLADLAMRLSRPDERDLAASLAKGAAGPVPRVPRALRPLAVLRALSWRRLRRDDEAAARSPAALAVAMRAGLFGR
ncbi:hypothetical protein B2G71_18375 [Novosphingobium sp. PC22D]|uniref:hypothetical protein n=1 Tax=Novosphingobium sp. PC22D TaxID=1962403 RepID=UPI000BF13F93|nr:hypothetical protein [Novosphingobium sp. PC22D]PEQ11251.1 hypothetical protein B2G71_18375 [Novosphingobium sp. PC22D]